MTVLTYCLNVQQAVLAWEPKRESPRWGDWFADTGRASKAVSLALECKNPAALALAEALAEDYAWKTA